MKNSALMSANRSLSKSPKLSKENKMPDFRCIKQYKPKQYKKAKPINGETSLERFAKLFNNQSKD